jgi:macrodomain Ter protein organizer (MatP/YcbG family)
MARPAFKIMSKDFTAARRYIMNAMDRGDLSSVEGYTAFRNAEKAEQLQQWCDDYMSSDVFEKMKRAIRAARKRSKDWKTTTKKVGVDLDHAAHLHLSSVADELGVTLSDAILILEETYWKAKDAGL